MRLSKNNNRLFFVYIIFSFFLLSGCQTLNKAKISPEDALRNRVTAYWDARVQDQPEKAYEMIEPDAKQSLGLSTYTKRTSQSKILSYKIEDITVDSENREATVRVARSFRIKPGVIPINIDKPLQQTADSKWVCIDGQWYMKYAVLPQFNFGNPYNMGDKKK